MNAKALLFGLIIFLLAAGCASKTRVIKVEVPPRVDLRAYPMVGLVGFASNARGELDRLSTERFLRAVQDAQPGTRVIELGSEADVLASVNGRAWDAVTLRALKEKHGVDVLVVGRLEVERAKPDFSLSTVVKRVSVRQDVNAALTTRLIETHTGATMWTDGAKLTTDVAHASFNGRGEGNFAAHDADEAYGAMVDALVFEVTDDFRARYVTRRVRKEDIAVASAAD